MASPATQLATMAGTYLQFEQLTGGPSSGARRAATRDMLRRDARKLGIAPDEIEAAIEAALKTATTKEPRRQAAGIS